MCACWFVGPQNWHNALPKEAATQAEKLPWKSVLKEKLKETIEYIMD